MSVINALSDVDVIALSIVKAGANRQRIFLKKSAEGDDDLDLFELPSSSKIVKAADWSAFYCVVAEPGAHELPGMTGEGADIWASEDEIRKAAHRFMRNGGLVNRMHESLEPYGAVVENAVALSDIDVNGETIKKGSWYVAVEPTDEGKRAIDDGEFTGVSLQGVGTRTTVSKVPGPPGTDISRNQGKQFGPLHNLIQYYLKKPHPFTACVRDNTKRFGPDGAKRVCAALKDIGLQTTKWRKGRQRAGLRKADDSLARSEIISRCEDIWLNAGLDHEDAKMVMQTIEKMTPEPEHDLYELEDLIADGDSEAEALEKAKLSYGQRKKLPKGSFAKPDKAPKSGSYPIPDIAHARNALARASGKPEEDSVKRVVYAKFPELNPAKKKRGKVAKAFSELIGVLGIEAEADQIEKAIEDESATLETTQEDQVADAITTDQFEALEKQVKDLSEKVTPVVERLAKRLDEIDEKKAPTIEELTKSVKDMGEAQSKLADDLKKLAAGDSAQGDDPDGKGEEDLEKSADRKYAEALL